MTTMKKNRKEERNQEVLEILKDHTLQEVADMFDVSRQRIYQIAEMYDFDFGGRSVGRGTIYRKIDESGLVGTMPDAEVARVLGVGYTSVSKWRERLGIEPFERPLKPIGCEKCKTNPYAKGLCKACHTRAWRRGLLGD